MSGKILVVDDEPDLQLLIRQKFRNQMRSGEFDFLFAEDGVQALQMLADNPAIDMVLTDINMPNMDGLTLLGKIKEFDTNKRILIVSAYGDMENIRIAMNRGAHDFVTKPINFSDLETTIRKSLADLQILKKALESHDQLIALQRELEVATRIQMSFLPSTFPQRNDLAIYAKMIPAKEVGGDFYDFFFIDEYRLGLVIGDVAGKGIPAAIFMAMTRALIKATALRGGPGSNCIQTVNRILYLESMPNMFVTVFFGVFDTQTGDFEYCNAGHHPPLIIRKDGKVEALEYVGGMALGITEKIEYQSKSICLQPGETIFFFTDGLTEAMDSKDNEFSETKLQSTLAECHAAGLKDLLNATIAKIQDHQGSAPQNDDMTAMVMRYLSDQTRKN